MSDQGIYINYSNIPAGELMRLMLEQMYLTSPSWAVESSPVPAFDLREGVNRMTDRPLLSQHIDQYLKVLGGSSSFIFDML